MQAVAYMYTSILLWYTMCLRSLGASLAKTVKNTFVCKDFICLFACLIVQ